MNLKNDDRTFLLEKLLECDGAIVGAPAYHLMPPGFLTMVGNRLAIGRKIIKEKLKNTRRISHLVPY